jgi:hypothetical protein
VQEIPGIQCSTLEHQNMEHDYDWLWQDVPNPSILKRTEGSLAAKLGSNAKFLPSANQAPIIVRCTEMCSDVPKTQAAKPSPGTTCESSPQGSAVFLSRGLLHWDFLVQVIQKWHALHALSSHSTSRKALPNLFPEVGKPSRYLQLANLTSIRSSEFLPTRERTGNEQGTNASRLLPSASQRVLWVSYGLQILLCREATNNQCKMVPLLPRKLNLPTKANPDPRQILQMYANVKSSFLYNTMCVWIACYDILSHGGQAAVPMFWTCSVTKSMKAYTKLRVAGSFHRERMSKHLKCSPAIPRTWRQVHREINMEINMEINREINRE